MMDRAGSHQIQGVQLREVAPADEPEPNPEERPSFAELFEAHSKYVWLTLRRLGARERDLEDLTHDVFLQVFRHLEVYDPNRPLKPWLFGFAFRVASEHRRRAHVRNEVPMDQVERTDPGPTGIDELLTKERLELAHAAMETLDLSKRAVFILHELDGCPIPEVAASLQIPLATAYSRLRLARRDFAEAAQRLRRRER